ncbi:MAG: nitrilase-related carbon-nitrogen hydrolase [Pseudomonadota bacterium]
MKVGYYQFRPIFGKPKQNCKKIIKTLKCVEADLIVLPELALSGYYFQNKNEALKYSEEPDNSLFLDSLCELALKRNMHLVIGFAERRKDSIYNSSALIGPNGIEHIYRKIHLFSEEKYIFEQGDIPFKINTINDVRVGMIICYDWAFPEAIRTLALQGAQIICQPANLVLNYCQQTMIARATENRVFIITGNRYGQDKRPHGTLKFTGRSQIVAPGGDLLHRSSAQREAIYICHIDPTEADNKSITKHDHLFDDRRAEFYY